MDRLTGNTARGIIRLNQTILLIERWRNNLHYFSIPGGHIEINETPEQTVSREVNEETTLTVQVNRQVFELRDGTRRHFIYLCTYVRGEPKLPSSSEEAKAAAQGNMYRPLWVDINQLSSLPFGYWEPLQESLILGLKHGFEHEVKVVSAAEAG